jgi:hypothetical protein
MPKSEHRTATRTHEIKRQQIPCGDDNKNGKNKLRPLGEVD